jgi:hypothetical protein
MPVKDCVTLEAGVEKGEPSRLLIEIALRQPGVSAVPNYEAAEIQRAIRDGFREIVTQAELQPLMANPPESRIRRWVGRTLAFIICAAISSAATLILSASHNPPAYAFRSSTRPGADPPASSLALPDPDSQSTGAPSVPNAAPTAAPTGPATFGLHEQ